MNIKIKSLAKKIEYFDGCYRRGEAKISDGEFDQLENNLRRVAPEDDCFNH